MKSLTDKQRIDYPILAITLFSVLYNCILAYINHNITPLSVSHVMLCEGMMMLYSVAYLLKRGIYEEDLPIFLYLIFTLIITIYITVLNRVPFIDQFRNVLIIVSFAGIGSWASERTVKLAFRIGCFFVLLFLVCEIVSTPFSPGPTSRPVMPSTSLTSKPYTGNDGDPNLRSVSSTPSCADRIGQPDSVCQ